MDAALRGAELAIGIVLTVAGVAKLADLDGTRLALTRLAGRSGRAVTELAPAIAAVEVAVGATLVVTPGRALALGVVALTSAFVAVVARARRLGAACGCFGSLFTGTSGPAERRRALALWVGAVSVAVWRTASAADHRASPPAVGIAAAGWLVALVLLSRRGAERLPGSVTRALAGRAPDRGGWRRVSLRERRRAVSAVRSASSTADVAAHPSLARPAWRTAKVRGRAIGRARVFSVSVRASAGTIQVLWSPGGPVNAVGHTADGPVLPGRAHARAA